MNTMTEVENRRTGGGSLTPQQVEFYDTEGYLVLPALLDEGDMAGVKASMSEHVDRIARDLFERGLIADVREKSPFESRLAELFENLTDADFLKYGRSWRDRLPGYFDLMSNAKILDAVESLIGGEIFANPVYNTRPKVPRVAAGAVPWHQDKSYWPDANSNPVITVWIPLVNSTLENGCLHIWPRTHRRKVLSWHRETYSGTGFTEIDEEHMKGVQAVPLPLNAGGAILFNDRCVHMSTPNNSKTVRWSVDLRYQPTDQDPMPQHGAGFLARSYRYPERVAILEDWLAERPERPVG
jgi:phytanoyl-CoA hydroxylase